MMPCLGLPGGIERPLSCPAAATVTVAVVPVVAAAAALSLSGGTDTDRDPEVPGSLAQLSSLSLRGLS
jgi:hypothetical protein